jgi:hypothetical protein
MKTIGQALKEFMELQPKPSMREVNAFIAGWTAHEVETQLKNGKI